tara:strand:- start:526 stop:966 length:441 start_codon:yes stop_codon:yes gene_type:complete
MTTLIFEGKDIKAIAKDTLDAEEWELPYESLYEDEDEVKQKKAIPSFTLVKDEGIYLMSGNTKSKLYKKGKNRVCYAKGYDPKVEDVWDKCRYAVGGDDFAEKLEVKEAWIALLSEKDCALKVEVHDDRWDLILDRKYLLKEMNNA